MPSGQRMLRPPGGSAKSGRNLHLHAMRIDIDRGARFDHVGHAFESHPAGRRSATWRSRAGRSRDTPAHWPGLSTGMHAGFEDVFALVRQRGGLGRVIVAGEHQHAAIFGGAGRVGVLEHVAAAVHAGPLPYHMENTPSYLASLNRLSCCVPQIEVAARSSFTPGWNLM